MIRKRSDRSEEHEERRGEGKWESKGPGEGSSYLQGNCGRGTMHRAMQLNSQGFTRQSGSTCPPPREERRRERREAQEANNVLRAGHWSFEWRELVSLEGRGRRGGSMSSLRRRGGSMSSLRRTRGSMSSLRRRGGSISSLRRTRGSMSSLRRVPGSMSSLGRRMGGSMSSLRRGRRVEGEREADCAGSEYSCERDQPESG